MNLIRLFSIFLLAIFIEVWPVVCHTKSPDCRSIFQLNFDEMNRIKSGSLNFLLEEEFNFIDVEIAVIFGFEQIALMGIDIPRLSLTGRELVLGYGQNITFDLHFNLGPQIPPIIRITAESHGSYKILCQNLQHLKHPVQIRVSSVLEKQETTELCDKKPIYKCNCFSRDMNGCIWSFYIPNLNESHPHFQPSCLTFSAKKVELHGNVHSLTDDMCAHFPEITHYFAKHIGLERVHANAFYDCRQLEHVDLADNNLITLPEDLLKNNPVLKKLRLSYNKLTSFDGKLFKFTPALTELKLSHTFITKFPLDNMPVLANLETLVLINNSLCNLNEGKIIYKFPELRTIYVSSGMVSTVKKNIELYSETVSVMPWK